MAPRQPGGEAADAVRNAVEQAYQATVGGAQLTRERAQELVDEVAQAAGRVREVLDDLRVAPGEDVSDVREEIAALERRVAALERRLAEAPAAKPRREA